MSRLVSLPLLAAVVWLPPAAASDPLPVRIEQTDGTTLAGRLVAIDEQSVRLEADGQERTMPLRAVRTIVRGAAAASVATDVVVTTVDGGTLTGTGFIQEGDQGVVACEAGRVEVPIERIRRVVWPGPGEQRPVWLDHLPQRPAADLVVVRREDGHALVECAIGAVSTDGVSVVLDGETIPVPRGKLLGLVWMRDETKPGGTVVTVAGGRLPASRVRWTPEALLLDDTARLPAAALRSIDFAAGRAIRLAAVPIEKTTCEPFFGGLGEQPGLAAFFAPRTVVDPTGERPARLIVRPRTSVTWRVPADSRRFRGLLERDVPEQAVAAVEVVLAVDSNEIFRRRLGGTTAGTAEPVAIDVDLAGGRRLMLTIDFAGGPGCGVRLIDGAFEQ